MTPAVRKKSTSIGLVGASQFRRRQHPRELAESDVNRFLTHLAVKEHVAASTQNQALSAILFLYTHVLNRGGRGVSGPADVLARRSGER